MFSEGAHPSMFDVGMRLGGGNSTTSVAQRSSVAASRGQVSDWVVPVACISNKLKSSKPLMEKNDEFRIAEANECGRFATRE